MISVPSSTPEKPRYRSACEPCRQSKVKCSGGSTCMRCGKHGFVCHYSIASRAGKPKGSKNKATLRKLETLQGKKLENQKSSSNGSGDAPRKTEPVISTPFRSPKDEVHQQSSRLGCELMATKLADSTITSLHIPDMDMDQAALAYLSPISTSPGNNHFMPDFSATESGPLSSSSGISDTATYLSRVSSDRLLDFSPPSFNHNSFTGPPTPVELCCDCLERQTLCQNELFFLEQDVASSASVDGRLDMMMDTMLSALAVCQRFAECPVCPKECSNLLVSLSMLERVFAVLGQMILFFRGGCSNATATPTQPAAPGPSPTEDGNIYTMYPEPAMHNLSPSVDRVLHKSRDVLVTLQAIIGPPPDLLVTDGNSHHQHHLHDGGHRDAWQAWQARTDPVSHRMNTLALGVTHDFSPPEYNKYDYSVEDEWFVNGNPCVLTSPERYQTRYYADEDLLQQVLTRCELMWESLHREWAGQSV